jgi:hypothetical protein
VKLRRCRKQAEVSHLYEKDIETTRYRLKEERTLRRWVTVVLLLCNPIAIIGILRLIELGKLTGAEAAYLFLEILGAINVTLVIVVRHLFPGDRPRRS